MVKETRKIIIGTMGTNPYVRHPLSLALSFHTFGEIADKRGIVGVCAGSEARLKKLGIKRSNPLSMLSETIEIMRKLAKGGQLEFHGRSIDVSGVNTPWIKNNLKIHICANGPRMLELAGKKADGVVLAHFPPSYTQWGSDHLKQGLAASGRSMSDFEYQVQPIVFVNESRNKAFEAARNYFQFLPPPIALSNPTILEICGFTREECNLIHRAFQEAFSSPSSKLPQGIVDKIVQNFAITGTPDEAIVKVREYEKSGITRVIVGFIPDVDIGERLAYFKREVIDKI